MAKTMEVTKVKKQKTDSDSNYEYRTTLQSDLDDDNEGVTRVKIRTQGERLKHKTEFYEGDNIPLHAVGKALVKADDQTDMEEFS